MNRPGYVDCVTCQGKGSYMELGVVYDCFFCEGMGEVEVPIYTNPCRPQRNAKEPKQ